MLVNLGDKLIIEDPDRYFKDRRKVHWLQDSVKRTVEFAFIPFHSVDSRADVSYIAVEVSRLDEFRELCREFVDTGGWGTIGVKNYEFTVTNQFKYGQNNASTNRFLVFQNPDYKPSQRHIANVSDLPRQGFIEDRDIMGSPSYRLMISLKASLADDLCSF